MHERLHQTYYQGINPEHIVFHMGTNDLNSSKTSTEIEEEIIDLANSVKEDNNNTSISGLIQQIILVILDSRADNLNNKAEEVNESLKKMCVYSSL